MMKIILVSEDEDKKRRLSKMIDDIGYKAPMVADTAQSAFDVMKDVTFDMVIVDEHLPDMSGVAFIRQLIMKNPMANCALFSSLSSEDFHESTEGLGIIGKIPLNFSVEDIKQLFDQLAQILGLFTVKPAGGQS